MNISFKIIESVLTRRLLVYREAAGQEMFGKNNGHLKNCQLWQKVLPDGHHTKRGGTSEWNVDQYRCMVWFKPGRS